MSETGRFSLKNRPPYGGVWIAPLPAAFWVSLVCQNFKELYFYRFPGFVFVLRFAPFSFYSINGSSAKKQRGDE